MTIDMPDASSSFEMRGGWLINRLAAEFGLTSAQASGIVGNVGFESGGLKILQEIHPVAGRGGCGWAQWTGPRRRAFESWCTNSNLAPDSDEANYGYLLVELHHAYQHTIDELKKTKTDADAVFSVGQTYERPGGTTATHLPGFNDRLRYARLALAGISVITVDPLRGVSDAGEEAASIAAIGAVDTAIRALQTALAAIGLYKGKIDGVWGPHSSRAIAAYRGSPKIA